MPTLMNTINWPVANIDFLLRNKKKYEIVVVNIGYIFCIDFDMKYLQKRNR